MKISDFGKIIKLCVFILVLNMQIVFGFEISQKNKELYVKSILLLIIQIYLNI